MKVWIVVGDDEVYEDHMIRSVWASPEEARRIIGEVQASWPYPELHPPELAVEEWEVNGGDEALRDYVETNEDMVPRRLLDHAIRHARKAGYEEALLTLEAST